MNMILLVARGGATLNVVVSVVACLVGTVLGIALARIT
jgi:hypothetical protein